MQNLLFYVAIKLRRIFSIKLQNIQIYVAAAYKFTKTLQRNLAHSIQTRRKTVARITTFCFPDISVFFSLYPK